MDLLRRKLIVDRVVWLVVALATVFVASAYVTRGGTVRMYLLYVWGGVVVVLLATELRIGRRQPKPGGGAFFAGRATLLGEEVEELDGSRRPGWQGTVSGVVELGPAGLSWKAREESPDVREIAVPWKQIHGWRVQGVLPALGRASGYLSVTVTDGREFILGVSGQRRWRREMREAAIVGPTLARPDWMPDEPAPGFGEPLAVAIGRMRSERAAEAVATRGRAMEKRPEPVPLVESEAPATELAVAEPIVAASEPVGVAPDVEAFVSEEVPVVQTAPAVEAELEPVIGLECHVELSTASKVFCGCPTSFGADPNTQICPVCTGQPGSLPVLNERAMEYALKIGLALNCRIAPRSVFHRKNYFYPDMPKDYQISQYDLPLATDGFLDVEVDGNRRRIRITRVHLEEDTGKTTHVGGGGRIGQAEYAKIDYNRAGVPLVEVVSEPDITSPAEARAYLQELRALLLWLGVSDVRMEEGSLRCDANVSVRAKGASELGVKTEVKNMNSMRSVQRALEFEIERLRELVSSGQTVPQETRHFDESTGRTISGRSKEHSADYRYFPDPDLVPVEPSQEWLEKIKASIPELPAERRRRFVEQHGLPEAAARTLTSSLELAAVFEAAVVEYGGEATKIARWYTGELAGIANDRGVEAHEAGVTPAQVAELQRLIDDGKLTDSQAKSTVLRKVAETGRDPSVIVAEEGLTTVSDESELFAVIDGVLAENADVVQSIKGGREEAIGVLIGKVREATKGGADPKALRQLIRQRIDAS